MFILDRRTFMAATGGAMAYASSAGLASAASLAAEIYTADDAGFLVDSTVILGEKSALVIDAQVNVANATRLADAITATGRTLETVLITHHHPDHVLGLAVLMDRFPDARPVTHRLIRPLIEAQAPGALSYLSAQAPGAYAGRVIVPDELEGDKLMFEGERIEIIGPMHGDTAHELVLHVPSLDTVIAADTVYADTHVWTEENVSPEAIAKWQASLDLIEGIGAGTIIPGHRLASSANDATAVAHTRAYLKQWEAALQTTRSAEELQAAMMAGNDHLGLQFALQRAIAAVYPAG